MSEYWHSGLCDCTDDCCLCCTACWCPCIQFGTNEEKLGEGNCCLCCTFYYFFSGFSFCFLWNQRSKVRAKYGIVGSGCNDCCVASFCSSCSLCQVSREINYQLTHPKDSRRIVYVVKDRNSRQEYSYDDYDDSNDYDDYNYDDYYRYKYE